MKIDFTQEQLIVLDKAIQQLPYYVAAPLILHINAEIKKQESNEIEVKPESFYCKTHQQNGESL